MTLKFLSGGLAVLSMHDPELGRDDRSRSRVILEVDQQLGHRAKLWEGIERSDPSSSVVVRKGENPQEFGSRYLPKFIEAPEQLTLDRKAPLSIH
jgi:hypothetical protein